MYHDDFEKIFNKVDELIMFLRNMETGKRWEVKKANTLSVVAAGKIPTDKISSLEELDSYKDTLDNSGLYLKSGKKKYPVGLTAMKTIYDRCRLHGAVLGDIPKDDLVTILNKVFPYAKGDALIQFSAGKIRAVLSDDYQIIPMHEIFEAANRILNKDFKGCRFDSGSYDHILTIGKWVICDKRIAEVYHKAIGDNVPDEAVRGAVKIVSSDVGCSGANISVQLEVKGRQIFLGSSKKLDHKGQANIGRFEDNLRLAYSLFKESISNLETLKAITIKHPNECMVNVMKRAGIKANLISETVELRNAVNKSITCNALDLYFDICQCVDIAMADGLDNGRLISDLEEKVASCLFLKWKEYDLSNVLNTVA